jgi:glycine cleavage system aminomethyltransferase T
MVLAWPDRREPLYQSLLQSAQAAGCLHVTDVTSVYAAFHLIGPKTTELLKELGSAPVDNIAVNGCVQTTTCRVWSLLIRRPALQSSAWLVLVSRDYGEYVWDSIRAAGRKHDIHPFGLSAAKVLAGMEAFDAAIV